MKNYRCQGLVLLMILVALACNNETKTIEPPLSNLQKIDSIKNNELNPIKNKYLIFQQRAVIRPVYQEIEKNTSAAHDGYMVSLSLKNNANYTTYGNIEIEINYFSKAAKQSTSEKIILKAPIKPGDSIATTQRIKKYNNTSYSVNLVSAKATQ